MFTNSTALAPRFGASRHARAARSEASIDQQARSAPRAPWRGVSLPQRLAAAAVALTATSILVGSQLALVAMYCGEPSVNAASSTQEAATQRPGGASRTPRVVTLAESPAVKFG